MPECTYSALGPCHHPGGTDGVGLGSMPVGLEEQRAGRMSPVCREKPCDPNQEFFRLILLPAIYGIRVPARKPVGSFHPKASPGK